MDKASVFRTEESSQQMLDILGDLKDALRARRHRGQGRVFNYDLTEALELGYLLDLAEASWSRARARTESRGAHFRDDHPERDDANWLKHTLACREPTTARSRLDYKPVELGKLRTHGAEVLMPESSSTSASAEGEALRPRSRHEAALAGRSRSRSSRCRSACSTRCTRRSGSTTAR